MEPEFLKERLERFLKIIPAEYKVADEIKKSPKGFSTTLERSGTPQQKQAKPKPVEEVKDEPKKPKAKQDEQKSKKKSLDELLEEGMV